MVENDLAKLGRRLLARAAGDLAALRELVDKENVPDAAVGFFAQQTAEKALNAVLARGADFKRVDDLLNPADADAGIVSCLPPLHLLLGDAKAVG